jgi:hypothetical protein
MEHDRQMRAQQILSARCMRDVEELAGGAEESSSAIGGLSLMKFRPSTQSKVAKGAGRDAIITR